MSETPSRRPPEVLSEYTISLPPKTTLFEGDPYRNPQARSFVTIGSVDFAYEKAGYGKTHIPGTITACHHPDERPSFSLPDRIWYIKVQDLNAIKQERFVPKRGEYHTPDVPERPSPAPTPPPSDAMVQGAFTSLLREVPIDETAHLRPNGKARRNTRRR